MRISCPLFKNFCYFGTDIDSMENLIVCMTSLNEAAKEIGADTLGYLSIEEVRKSREREQSAASATHALRGIIPVPCLRISLSSIYNKKYRRRTETPCTAKGSKI